MFSFGCFVHGQDIHYACVRCNGFCRFVRHGFVPRVIFIRTGDIYEMTKKLKSVKNDNLTLTTNLRAYEELRRST